MTLSYLVLALIFSTCFDDHCMHLVTVLQKLKDAGPTVKQSKCEWAVAVCNYFGLVVGYGKRRPKEGKVVAIQDFPVSKSTTQIRPFLGLPAIIGTSSPSMPFGHST